MHFCAIKEKTVTAHYRRHSGEARIAKFNVAYPEQLTAFEIMKRIKREFDCDVYTVFNWTWTEERKNG